MISLNPNFVYTIKFLLTSLTRRHRVLFFCSVVLNTLTVVLEIYSYALVASLLASFVTRGDSAAPVQYSLVPSIVSSYPYAYSIVIIIVSFASRISQITLLPFLSIRFCNSLLTSSFRGFLTSPYLTGSSLAKSSFTNTFGLQVCKLHESYLALFSFISSLATVLGFLSILFLQDADVAIKLIFIVALPFLLFLVFVSSRLDSVAATSIRRSRQVLSLITDIVYNLKVIKVDHLENMFTTLYSSTDFLLRISLIKEKILSSIPRIFTDFYLLLLILFTLLLWNQTVSTLISASYLSLLLLSLTRLIPSFQQLLASYNNLIVYGRVLQPMETFLHREPTLSSPASPFFPSAAHTSLDFKSLRLSDVSFTYPTSTAPVLTGINLILNRGEYLGIVGPSGCGKTTLTDIVSGIAPPTSGRLLVNEVDIYDSCNTDLLERWLAAVALVEQNTFLFSDTLANNILLKKPTNSSSITLDRALDLSALSDLIPQLDSGIHTRIGDGGRALSGGQRQRVGLARALAKSTQFLVLDEFTSALDLSTEDALLNNIRSIHSLLNNSALIISHRTQPLALCDRIISL